MKTQDGQLKKSLHVDKIIQMTHPTAFIYINNILSDDIMREKILLTKKDEIP